MLLSSLIFGTSSWKLHAQFVMSMKFSLKIVLPTQSQPMIVKDYLMKDTWLSFFSSYSQLYHTFPGVFRFHFFGGRIRESLVVASRTISWCIWAALNIFFRLQKKVLLSTKLLNLL